MQPLLDAVLSNLIVASAIAATALILARFWKNPILLHLLWLLVLIKLVTPPVVSWSCLPDWSPSFARPSAPLQIDDESRPTVKQNVNKFKLTDQRVDPPAPLPEQDLLDANASEHNPGHQHATTLLLPQRSSGSMAPATVPRIWISIVFLFALAGSAVWFVVSVIQIVGFARKLRPATSVSGAITVRTAELCERVGMQRTPQVLLLPGNLAPMIWAPFARSWLLLPRDLVGTISPEKRDALITHEIGHLYFRHHWVRHFEFFVTGLFWWCPLVWMARKKLREFEEEICDAWVVHTIPGVAEAYANVLLDTVEFLSTAQKKLPPVATGNSHFRFLNRRITMIMQNESRPTLSLTGWTVAIAVMVCGLPLSLTAASSGAAG